MTTGPKAKLKPFLRHGLDVLFVALNPATESNERGHYFSGSRSKFYDLLTRSGLLTESVDRSMADELIFGGTSLNYRGSSFGVFDLVPDIVDSSSRKVRPSLEQTSALLRAVRVHDPRFVCAIHSRVMRALNRCGELSGKLEYGVGGRLLPGSRTIFAANYFPNGNPIPDRRKIEIFRALKRKL